MKKILLASALLGLSLAAAAQERGRVISATPIVQQVGTPQQVCGNETVYGGSRNTGAGAVMGAIAGGAAGNAIGGGGGRAAATMLGVIGGAVLGNQIEGPGQPQYQNVQRCVTETYYENRTTGYDVVYEYAGRQYTTRTPTDPGPWIALDVNVQPAQGVYSSQPPAQYMPQPGVVSTYPIQPPAYIAPQAPVTVIEYNHMRPYYPPPPRGPYYWR